MTQQENEQLIDHEILHVLTAFVQMGASTSQLEQECERLCADAGYCRAWAMATGFYDNMRRY
jgi:hypothetical protein